MSFIRQSTGTITLSTLGAASTYLPALNGLVCSVYVKISKAIGANGAVTISNAWSTAMRILTVKDPSTLGVFYYPHRRAQTSTGGTIGSSEPTKFPLCDNRLKVVVATSSGLSGQTVTVKVSVK